MNAPEEQPTSDEQLVRLIDQYRAGLEAEIAILHQLAEAAHRQGADSGSGDADAFHKAADERDRLMQGLVTIEPICARFVRSCSACREQASRLAGFADVASLHRDAAASCRRHSVHRSAVAAIARRR
jgi:hypothetical protein